MTYVKISFKVAEKHHCTLKNVLPLYLCFEQSRTLLCLGDGNYSSSGQPLA